ncbi:MAG: transposase [Coleofasciculus sp. G2-EDA-02]
MRLAERHIIKKGHRFWREIDRLSWQSKNLYNSANYLIRQNWIYGHGYLTYNQMASLMKETEQYKALPAKVSQQVLRGLDRNWKSFFAANSEFKKHPDKFIGRPKIPGYKDTKNRTNQGVLVQSDVIGSYNILRKAFPNAFNRYGIERCVVHYYEN